MARSQQVTAIPVTALGSTVRVISKGLVLLLILLTACLCAGCWGTREPDRLGIVLAAAIDRTPDDGFLWTVAIARPRAISSAAGGGSSDPSEQTVVYRQGWGKSLGEGQQRLHSAANREIIWSHANFIMIGEEAARRGIGPILEFISRQYNMRANAQFMVTRGRAGEYLINSQPELEDTLSRAFVNFLLRPREQMGPFVDLNRTIRTLQEDGRDTVAMFLDFAENAPNEPEAAGTAAFHEDRLVAIFTGTANLGLLWALDEDKQFNMRLPCPEDPTGRGFVGIRVLRSHTKQGTSWRDGRPHGWLRATINADINEWACSQPVNEETIQVLDDIGSEVIRSYMEEAINRLKAARSDAIGFGLYLYRTDPARWHQVRQSWRDIFATMPVSIQAKLNIRRTGMTLEAF